MSAVSPSDNETPEDSSTEKTVDKKNAEKPDHIYLVSYPKIIFLYPTVLAALACAVFMWAKGDIPETHLADTTESTAPINETAATENPNGETEAAATEKANATATKDSSVATEVGQAENVPTYHYVCARIFLLIFFLNLVVIAFDFPRTTSLTWFFAVVAITIGIWTLFRLNEGLAPKVFQSLLSVQPAANSSFYFIFTLGMLFLSICVLVSRRFDYWEVRGNELLHHHGVLSDLKRFSAPNLRIDKEINDVFEYLLLRSGRLILHPSNERRAIVLENVLFISNKEDRITRMLGALQVRVRTDPE